jgi:hypothetical protein
MTRPTPDCDFRARFEDIERRRNAAIADFNSAVTAHMALAIIGLALVFFTFVMSTGA